MQSSHAVSTVCFSDSWLFTAFHAKHRMWSSHNPQNFYVCLDWAKKKLRTMGILLSSQNAPNKKQLSTTTPDNTVFAWASLQKVTSVRLDWMLPLIKIIVIAFFPISLLWVAWLPMNNVLYICILSFYSTIHQNGNSFVSNLLCSIHYLKVSNSCAVHAYKLESLGAPRQPNADKKFRCLLWS